MEYTAEEEAFSVWKADGSEVKGINLNLYNILDAPYLGGYCIYLRFPFPALANSY